jgi:hypothetical protein
VEARGGVRAHAHKHRGSGAFLMSNAAFDPPSPREVKRRALHAHNGNRVAGPSSSPSGKVPNEFMDGAAVDDSRAGSSKDAHDGHAPVEGEKGKHTEPKRTSIGQSPRTSNASAGNAAADLDTSQIVDMALRLGESRRQASKRISSHPIPPKLSPLPDSAATGSLRQHLQQQRRVSRTISPKPAQGSFSRRVGSRTVSSPLQGGFDLGEDDGYCYNFSEATKARAQKAKDYLELQAQNRRLLDFVPPLEPSKSTRPSISEPSSAAGERLGRAYNPLQYIRNRKVRGRARQAIDGRSQGFGDVEAVTDWVDDVAKQCASQSAQPGEHMLTLPAFASADEAMQLSPTSGQPRSSTGSTRPKRPRVDWFIEPSDMLADVYWLEQGDNKRFVEDRHWKRVFPQDTAQYRPMSRATTAQEPSPPSARDFAAAEVKIETTPEKDVLADIPAKPSPKADRDNIFSGARSKARQRLHDIRGSHHRHSSSTHSHDLFKIHRGSFSESSDTEGDRVRRARNGTITSSGKNILEKQMLEMMAKEARERDDPSIFRTPPRVKTEPTEALHKTPQHQRPGSLLPVSPSRGPSPRASTQDLKEAEASSIVSRMRQDSPLQPVGRSSLEVPSFANRGSFDYESSMPNSPEVRPVRLEGRVPAIGMDLSPGPSRSASPAAKPFQRVRGIFRDRGTREPSAESPVSEKNSVPTTVESPDASRVASPERLPDMVAKQNRTVTLSPVRQTDHRLSGGLHHRLHKPQISGKARRDESSGGLRGLFKGRPIETAFRSGVSKISEVFWPADAAKAGIASAEQSADETDSELRRGRTKGSSSGRPSISGSEKHPNDEPVKATGRSYSGILPSFRPLSQTHLQSSSPSPEASRRTSRFDLLKPPRIDVLSASPRSTSPILRIPSASRAASSESDSRKSSYTDGVRDADARLNAILALPPPLTPSRSQFSISDAKGRQLSNAHSNVAAKGSISSRRDIARQRAMLLSSGILAMEVSRRANEARRQDLPSLTASGHDLSGHGESKGLLPHAIAADPSGSCAITWPDITRYAQPPASQASLISSPISQAELYPLAARILASSVQTASHEWQASVETFTDKTVPGLQGRIDTLRHQILHPDTGLSSLVRRAADEADEVSRDLSAEQRLKVKRVVDVIEKLARRRRRRFRWVRRAGWLAVEWVLVGFMWYVWFVVMIARIVLGIGLGVGRAVRWLLWL